MKFKHTDIPGAEYLVARDPTEYAILGSALEEARAIVNGAPNTDLEMAQMTILVNAACLQWEQNYRDDIPVQDQAVRSPEAGSEVRV